MSLTAEIIQALRTSSYWTEKTKENSKYIHGLICPECGEQEAYAHRESPFTIFCNRQNHCGAAAKTMPLLGISANVETPGSSPPNKTRIGQHVSSSGCAACLLICRAERGSDSLAVLSRTFPCLNSCPLPLS